MSELRFRDFLETYLQQDCVIGEVPVAIVLNARAEDLETWRQLDERLQSSGAPQEVRKAGKAIWRRYRVACRSTLT